MRTSHEQLSNICEKAYKYYLEKFGQYIDNPKTIKLSLDNQLEFPSDKLKVPACTHFEDDHYIINFNIPLLLTTFREYINLICWHEVAHVVCDELYRCNDKIKQSKNVNGGHPVLFFKIINSWKDKTRADIEMQKNRHDIPYNYGRSDGFDLSYNPVEELIPVVKKFSYRINKIFGG